MRIEHPQLLQQIRRQPGKRHHAAGPGDAAKRVEGFMLKVESWRLTMDDGLWTMDDRRRGDGEGFEKLLMQ
jgi:hypothetical protein